MGLSIQNPNFVGFLTFCTKKTTLHLVRLYNIEHFSHLCYNYPEVIIMLDKKTEEVLRFIHSKHQAFSAKGYSVYLTSDKLGIEHPELRSICEYLRSIGFINCTFSKTVNQITASITREGIAYLEAQCPPTLKDMLLKWFKDNILELIAIIISIIALLKP